MEKIVMPAKMLVPVSAKLTIVESLYKIYRIKVKETIK